MLLIQSGTPIIVVIKNNKKKGRDMKDEIGGEWGKILKKLKDNSNPFGNFTMVVGIMPIAFLRFEKVARYCGAPEELIGITFSEYESDKDKDFIKIRRNWLSKTADLLERCCFSFFWSPSERYFFMDDKLSEDGRIVWQGRGCRFSHDVWLYSRYFVDDPTELYDKDRVQFVARLVYEGEKNEEQYFLELSFIFRHYPLDEEVFKIGRIPLFLTWEDFEKGGYELYGFKPRYNYDNDGAWRDEFGEYQISRNSTYEDSAPGIWFDDCAD